MAQPVRILKRARFSIPLLVVGAGGLMASGCEAINEAPGGGRLPAAPKTVAVSQPEAAAGSAAVSRPADLASAPATTIADVPAPGSSVDAWRAAQAKGLVVTDVSPSEYTRKYLNQDYGQVPDPAPTVKAERGQSERGLFTGETYSVVEDRAPAPQYVTADGQPYPDYEVASPAASEQRFATAAAQYSTYETSPDTAYGAVDQTRRTDEPASGSYAIHLASYRIEANAYKGWQVLSRRYGQLGGLQPRLSAVDIPGRGLFLRLKAGPFTSRDAAAQACQPIKASGDYCAVTGFDGASL